MKHILAGVFSGIVRFSWIFRDKYPDLEARGGLPDAVQSALLEIGSGLTVSRDEEFGPSYARVQSGARFSQVYIAAEERLFLFEFWAHGVVLASGQTPRLTQMASAIDMWVTSGCSASHLAGAFKFVAVKPGAEAYERGDEVEERWQSYLRDTGHRNLVPLVAAASHRPELRELFPYTSMGSLQFSRCTGYPFTRDTPYVLTFGDDSYQVFNASGVLLGRGNAEEAVALVVANLPSPCGPAVRGTADDVART